MEQKGGRHSSQHRIVVGDIQTNRKMKHDKKYSSSKIKQDF